MENFEKACLGESKAFDKMYRKYYPLVYKLEKKYYLKNFDHEDWLQEGRIIFFQTIKNYQEDRNVSLGKFFKFNFENHIRSLVRKQCAVKRTVDATSVSLEQKVENQGEEFLDYMKVESESPLDHMIIQEKMEDFPGTLSNFERATFQDYICGKELPDIAEEQRLKEKIVRGAFDRAKRKLKDILYD